MVSMMNHQASSSNIQVYGLFMRRFIQGDILFLLYTHPEKCSDGADSDDDVVTLILDF